MSEPILSARDLHISFGGVKAADGVSLDVARDELVAIIGPNGSGKTTFLNLCTGYLPASRGSVLFEGSTINGLSPRAITRRGIARAFQIPQLFTTHSLVENVMLAVAARSGMRGGLGSLTSYRSEAQTILDLVSLGDMAEVSAAALPGGMSKLADIALALALRPRLLLLDEPTSGVSAGEKFAVMETIVDVLRRERVTALFVEHDMEVVERYADRVLVWDAGRVVAEGDPHTILSSPDVIERVIGVA